MKDEYIWLDTNEKFIEKCTDTLIHKYGRKIEDVNSSDYLIARRRYSEELNRVISFGYKDVYAIARKIVELATRQHVLAFGSGNSAYSFIAYLYGITLVDAVKYDLDQKMIFDRSLKKKPFFTIAVSDIEKVKESVIEEFGEDSVHIEQLNRTAIFGIDNTNTTIDVAIIEEPFLQTVQNMFPEKGDDMMFRSWRHDVLGSHHLELREEGVKKVLFDFLNKAKNADRDISDKEKFLNIVCNGTFDGVMSAVAIIKGNGVWKANESVQGLNIYTREGIVKHAQMETGDSDVAFEIMDVIRKGKSGIPEKYRAMFSDAFIQFCDNIKYVVGEGYCVPYANLICYLSVFAI